MTEGIGELRLFAGIVAAGSLSEAARRMHSSLPAVSRGLAALEGRLGVRLLKRGPRRLTLTDEGSLLHERVVTILRDVDAAEAEANEKAKRPTGYLRVAVPLEIGRRRIAPMVARFTEENPGITVELVLTDSHFDILAEDIDIGLQVHLPRDDSVVSRTLLNSRRVICASPDYLARRPTPKRPLDLLDHDCIRLIRGRHVFDRWIFKEDGCIVEVPIRGSLLTNNAEVMHDWALAGRAISIKALWDVEDDLRSGRLVELLEPFCCDELKLYATYATRRHLPPRMRVLIDFLVGEL